MTHFRRQVWGHPDGWSQPTSSPHRCSSPPLPPHPSLPSWPRMLQASTERFRPIFYADSSHTSSYSIPLSSQTKLFSFPRCDLPVVSESASVQEAGRTQCESRAERADRLLVKVRMVLILELLVLVRMPWNTSREISLLIHTHHDGTVYNAVEQINIMPSFLRPKIEDGGGKRGSQVIC